MSGIADTRLSGDGFDERAVVRTRVSTSGGAPYRFGSGYLIAPGLILTARHVLAAPGESDSAEPGRHCEACRPLAETGAVQWSTAEVVWASDACDVAVVRATDMTDGVAAVSWGRLEGPGPLRWVAAGYPIASADERGRHSEGLFGRTSPITEATAGRLGLTVESRAPRETAQGSGWAGLSGAAVFSGHWLVGVVVSDPENFNGSLRAVRVEAFNSNRGLVAALGGPVEVEPVRSDNGEMISGPSEGGCPAVRTVSTPYGTVAEEAVVPTPPFREVPSRVARIRKVRRFLDRTDLLTQIREALAERRNVELYGTAGSGRTALISRLAHGEPFGWERHGVVFCSGAGRSTEELLTAIFDMCFDCEGSFRPTPSQVRHALADRCAIVLIDDCELDVSGCNAAFNAMRDSTFVLTTDSRRTWGDELAVEVDGLPLSDAVALLRSDGIVSEEDLSAAESLCQTLERRPLAIKQAAATLREPGMSLHALAADITAGSRLGGPEREVLAILLAFPQTAISTADVLAVSSLGDPILSLRRLTDRRLVAGESGWWQSLAGAEGLVSGPDIASARVDLVRHWAVGGSTPRSDSRNGKRNLAAGLAAFWWAVGDARPQVVPLARRLEDDLVLEGRWKAWDEVLTAAEASAAELGDMAARAWVLHQRGTRLLGLGQPGAEQLLSAALSLRKELGHPSASASAQNIRVAASVLGVAVSVAGVANALNQLGVIGRLIRSARRALTRVAALSTPSKAAAVVVATTATIGAGFTVANIRGDDIPGSFGRRTWTVVLPTNGDGWQTPFAVRGGTRVSAALEGDFTSRVDLIIRDGAGKTLAAGNDVFFSNPWTDVATLEKSGSYTLEVASTGGGSGTATLYEVKDVKGTIKLGETRSFVIDAPGENAYFTFSAPSGTRVDATLTGDFGLLTSIAITDSSGKALKLTTNNIGQGGHLREVYLKNGGQHTVVVNPYLSEIGGGTVILEFSK
ncbi:MAG TPA: trypsin-like peptidase domain-containing protein [Acidimicrobiales bacterium]|nr:trypsin-like peptidase domain-containing protein [Acidimicrobiales bacterium]